MPTTSTAPKPKPAAKLRINAFDHYPAKMAARLAEHALGIASKKGDKVFDPFCGCGTTLVEGRRLGRHVTGIDINPLAVIYAGMKSSLFDLETLGEVAKAVVCAAKRTTKGPSGEPWLSYWYTPKTLSGLLALRQAILRNSKAKKCKQVLALLGMLAVTARETSRADPRSPKPFISARAREDRVGRYFDPYEFFQSVSTRFIAWSAEYKVELGKGSPRTSVCLGDARRFGSRGGKRGVFDALVTSPPYLSAQDYYRSSKLELAILGLLQSAGGLDLGRRIMGSDRGVLSGKNNSKCEDETVEIKKLRSICNRSGLIARKYVTDMRAVLKNAYSILRPNGKCCLVVGDCMMRGVRLPVHRWVSSIAEAVGFGLVSHTTDRIRNRRVPPQRKGHDSVIDKEHILLFSRPAS